MKDYFPLFSLWLRRVESEHNHLYFSQGPLLTFVIHCYSVWAGASQKKIYIYQISIYIYIHFKKSILHNRYKALQIDLLLDSETQVAAHGPSGAWGTIAVSLFAEKHCGGDSELVGVFFGGGAGAWKHLGTQVLGVLILTGISLGFTYVIVMLVDFLFGFRCSRACELIGLWACFQILFHLFSAVRCCLALLDLTCAISCLSQETA